MGSNQCPILEPSETSDDNSGDVSMISNGAESTFVPHANGLIGGVIYGGYPPPMLPVYIPYDADVSQYQNLVMDYNNIYTNPLAYFPSLTETQHPGMDTYVYPSTPCQCPPPPFYSTSEAAAAAAAAAAASAMYLLPSPLIDPQEAPLPMVAAAMLNGYYNINPYPGLITGYPSNIIPSPPAGPMGTILASSYPPPPPPYNSFTPSFTTTFTPSFTPSFAPPLIVEQPVKPKNWQKPLVGGEGDDLEKPDCDNNRERTADPLFKTADPANTTNRDASLAILGMDHNLINSTLPSSAHQHYYNRLDFLTSYEDAKFFIIKSYSEDNVRKSIQYGVWASTPNGNRKLDEAYWDAQRRSKESQGNCPPIFLLFSVNRSRQFCGVAEMSGPVDYLNTMSFWEQNKWSGSFPVKWHIVKDVPNSHLRRIILADENKPVTNSRDTQEVSFNQGIELLRIFKSYPLWTSILDNFQNFYSSSTSMWAIPECQF